MNTEVTQIKAYCAERWARQFDRLMERKIQETVSHPGQDNAYHHPRRRIGSTTPLRHCGVIPGTSETQVYSIIITYLEDFKENNIFLN